MDSQELRIKIESQPLFVQKMIFVLCVLLSFLLLMILLFMPAKYNPELENYFKNKYFTIIKPQGWNWVVDRQGESFIFRKKNSDAIIVVDVDTNDINKYSAVNLNPVQVREKIHGVLSTYSSLPSKNIEVSNIKAAKHEWVFSAMTFDFRADGFDGYGTLFYSKDMSCIYLGMWRPGKKRDYEYIVKTCANYIRLKDPYDKPLFVRPVIDTSDKTDYLELQHEAQNKIKLAKELWKSDKGMTSNNTKIALEAFQEAFRKLAEADDMAYAIESETMEQYLECRKAREAMIDNLVSKIIQQDIMQNHAVALQRIKQLIAMATLESEAKIREWGKQQYQKLRPDKKKKEE